MKRVIVPLAPDFEEVEAVAIIDVLRRAGVDVVVAGLGEGPVKGAHGISITPDCALAEVSAEGVDMIVLPGGMPGADHLKNDERVQALVRDVARQGGYCAAICAAPMALSAAGVTAGRVTTSYPGFDDRIECAEYAIDRVVVDGRVITSRGPGTALEFALTLVALLDGDEKAASLQESMLVARAESARTVRAST